MTQATTPLDHALAYAARGWPVFPCRHAPEDVVNPETGEVTEYAAKTPLTGIGFRAASTTPRIIERWWRDWPDAMIGVPTGDKIKAWVLDIDPRHGGDTSLAALEDEHGPLPDTLTARTAGGGRHYYFAHVKGVRNRASLGELGDGIDVRGDGGYVIAPGSVTHEGRDYHWERDCEPADAPQWLLDLVVRREPPPVPVSPARTQGNTPYVTAAVDRELADLAATPMGNRNNALNDAAFALGQFVGAGALGEGEARNALQATAKQWGRDWTRCVKTIDNGLKAGIAAPRDIPEPAARNDAALAAEGARIAAALLKGAPTDGTAELPPRPRSRTTVLGMRFNAQAFWDDYNPPPEEGALIQTTSEFLSDFKPPAWHIKGITQRGYLYLLTAPTGTGKTSIMLDLAASTATGNDFAGRGVKRGRVLYLAGENPDDVRARWKVLSYHMEFDPDHMEVDFIPGQIDINVRWDDLVKSAQDRGGYVLVIVDTSSAFFLGEDENDNVQALSHAKMLRALSLLEGNPCVMVACHPIKNADMSNILPRGGGSFVAEVDGNLVLVKQPDSTIKLTWHGKHRGPGFDPLNFELHEVTCPDYVDEDGDEMPSVMAKAMSASDIAKKHVEADRLDGDILLQIRNDGTRDASEIARAAGMDGPDDAEKYRKQANKAINRLKKAGLIQQRGSGQGRVLFLTQDGDTVAAGRSQERWTHETGEKISESLTKQAVAE